MPNSKRAVVPFKSGSYAKRLQGPVPDKGGATPPLCPRCKSKPMTKDGHTARGKQRWTCKKGDGASRKVLCYTTTDPCAPFRDQTSKARRPDERPRFNRKLESKIFVVTAAQNATPPHEKFLQTLKTFCKHNDAELIVIPLRYKNPTSRWTQSQENAEVWDAALQPYLFNQRRKLNDNIVLLADIKTQPTMMHPLTSLEGHTHGESGIIGHTKLQFKTVPTPQSKLPKMMTTTGAVTVANYTDTRIGKQGEFHHILGAVVIEVESRKVFHMHHIQSKNDGSFILNDKLYDGDNVEQAPPATAIVFGDAHYRFHDPATVRGTFDDGGLLDVLQPEALVWHDLLDAYAVSPHHEHNPIIQLAKHKDGFNNIEREVRETVAWLIEKSRGIPSYIVPSNHDDMLARWILRADWKTDPENAEFYLQTALQMVRSAGMGDGGARYLDPFVYWADRIAAEAGAKHIIPLARGQSLLLGGHECSMHGDKGPNGARGSIKNLSRLGVKVVSGHGHAPAIEEGHTRTGTMSRLNLEYNQGPSGWLNSHASIDALGKAHLHHCINGKFMLRRDQ